ncbi:MarR family winged helix-turn-helix transcriptional regulator [Schnuerera sp. xch1]|uniref:MarR family winged helix-turn-helix transcriptional regulator n=1 Tax=Schnuerera sp. xch1 TaxID=2874283 RepID=UPI001CBB326E|nr:MarR family winged helix-turn-helix transcriptional regulator [Schnuerera sp. xch1]MBZ2174625.1 MarR family winged helix-turn-helix transcriptional regulator [Schnuerera sp. xch1]
MIEKDVAIQLKETYQRITYIMQSKIDEYGLTLGLLYLIILIEKKPNSSQKELAEEMRFTQGAMSSAVKRLLKLDMIEQIPLESDMRYNRLIVTEKGKSMIDDYKDYLLEIYSDMFIGFDYDELMKLYNSILKLNKNLSNISS